MFFLCELFYYIIFVSKSKMIKSYKLFGNMIFYFNIIFFEFSINYDISIFN